MRAFKNCRLAMIFLVMVGLGIDLLECVTTSQIQALEEKAQQALEKAEKALKECQSAKAAVEDSSRYSAKAAAKKCEDIFERITAR